MLKSEVMNEMGLRLRELRSRNGYSQQEISDILGVTMQAYSQYERGLRQPSYEILIQLKNCFGVTLDYLICGEERCNLLYDKLVFKEASRLPEPGKDELFHFLQYLSTKYRIRG